MTDRTKGLTAYEAMHSIITGHVPSEPVVKAQEPAPPVRVKVVVKDENGVERRLEVSETVAESFSAGLLTNSEVMAIADEEALSSAQVVATDLFCDQPYLAGLTQTKVGEYTYYRKPGPLVLSGQIIGVDLASREERFWPSTVSDAEAAAALDAVNEYIGRWKGFSFVGHPTRVMDKLTTTESEVCRTYMTTLAEPDVTNVASGQDITQRLKWGRVVIDRFPEAGTSKYRCGPCGGTGSIRNAETGESVVCCCRSPQ